MFGLVVQHLLTHCCTSNLGIVSWMSSRTHVITSFVVFFLLTCLWRGTRGNCEQHSTCLTCLQNSCIRNQSQFCHRSEACVWFEFPQSSRGRCVQKAYCLQHVEHCAGHHQEDKRGPICDAGNVSTLITKPSGTVMFSLN
jgi:hypothetical protein